MNSGPKPPRAGHDSTGQARKVPFCVWICPRSSLSGNRARGFVPSIVLLIGAFELISFFHLNVVACSLLILLKPSQAS